MWCATTISVFLFFSINIYLKEGGGGGGSQVFVCMFGNSVVFMRVLLMHERLWQVACYK